MSRARAIRFGGLETPDGFLFELSGGALALDFANTLDERPRGGLERLTDYPQIIRWSQQVGLLTEIQASRLLAAAASNPRAARRIHAEALELRELIFAAVKAATGSALWTEDQVKSWNGWLERVRENRRLWLGPQGLQWRDPDYGEALDHVVIAIAEAAIELIVDPDNRPRLRVCAAADCDWTFLDRSARQNRVWCDMTVCGNRAKAARHYRLKARK